MCAVSYTHLDVYKRQRQYGPDSYLGRCAAVMLGCTETTFYTVAVYFGAAGIKRTRYTLSLIHI